VGGSPDFLALPLEPNPIRRIALIDCRHWLLLTSVLDGERLARNWIFARKNAPIIGSEVSGSLEI
jgi:hypothetical protein